MATNDRKRFYLVVNNPAKPNGDAYIPPKGTQLHLALFDEAETIEATNEAIKQSPGIHSLANKLNGNLLMQRMIKAAMAKANPRPLDESAEKREG